MRHEKFPKKEYLAVLAASFVLCSAPLGGIAHGATVDSYMIIVSGDPGDGQLLDGDNVELGAIDSDTDRGDGVQNGPSITDPQGSWSIPPIGSVNGTNGIGPSKGITYDGDVAIAPWDEERSRPINSSAPGLTLSNVSVFSQTRQADTGDNMGAQGIDCQQSYNTCSDSGSQLSSNNAHGIPAGGSGTDMAEMGEDAPNNGDGIGAQGGYVFDSLFAELDGLYGDYTAAKTGDLDIGSSINSDLLTTYSAGLNLIDLTTSDTSKVLLEQSTWVIDGDANTYVVFRLEKNKAFDIEQSNLVIGDGGIGLSNILFITDSVKGVSSLNFNDVVFNGISFWDYGGVASDNNANFQNVIGCGQVVNDFVNFSNVAMSHCAFSYTPPAVIPVPGALPLGLTGLALLGAMGWSRRRHT